MMTWNFPPIAWQTGCGRSNIAISVEKIGWQGKLALKPAR